MSTKCVFKNKEFKDKAKQFNIHENTLELIVYKFINDPYLSNNGKIDFPKDSYIEYALGNLISTTKSRNVVELWEKKYSSPITFNSKEESYPEVMKAKECFGSNNVITYDNSEGKITMVVSLPYLLGVENTDDLVFTNTYNNADFQLDLAFFNLRFNKKEYLYSNRYSSRKEALSNYEGLKENFPELNVRLIQPKNGNNRWVITMNSPSITNKKYRLYRTKTLEEIVRDEIKYNEDLFYSERSSDDLLSDMALEEQENRDIYLQKSIDKYFSKHRNKKYSSIIVNSISNAIKALPKLKSKSPKEIVKLIIQTKNESLTEKYNELILNPIDKALEEHLTSYLRKLGIKVKEDNDILKHGAVGAYSVVNKVIYLADSNKRNQITLPEEFSHAFVDLFEGTEDFDSLYNEIVNTDIYQKVYNEYKDTYKKDDKPDDYKIRKEAIGLALAIAIKEKQDTTHSNQSFWTKLKEWFNGILDKLRGKEYKDFNSIIRTIATEVINNNYDRITTINSSEYTLESQANQVKDSKLKEEKKASNKLEQIYNNNKEYLFDEFKSLNNVNEETLMFQKTIIYNKEQREAIADISNFINQKLGGQLPGQYFYTLQGKAGTGKTTIINEILNNINTGNSYRRREVLIGAVAHKAKEVLSKKISNDARSRFTIKEKTIAGMLGMKQETKKDPYTGEYFEEYVPDIMEEKSIDTASIVFIDEASMLNEQSLEMIKDAIKGRNVAVICIGDIGQLPPIRKSSYYAKGGRGANISTDELSPIFTDKSIPKSLLSERVRQGEDSPVLEYADNYWNHSVGTLSEYPVDTKIGAKSIILNDGALVIQSSEIDLTKQLLPLFEEAKQTLNPNLVKIVAYTNNAVNKYNKELHFALHPEDRETGDLNFKEGDLIIFNDSFGEGPGSIYNSSEGSVVFVSESINNYGSFESELLGLPSVKYKNIDIKLSDGRTRTVPVLEQSPDNVRLFEDNITKMRNEAIKRANAGNRRFWHSFYDYKKAFANIGYAYAITSHKSQGSTYNVVAVDAKDINNVIPTSKKTKARSIYTALTRASNVTIVNSSSSQDDPPAMKVKDINDGIKEYKETGKEFTSKPKEVSLFPESGEDYKTDRFLIDGREYNISYRLQSTTSQDRLATSNVTDLGYIIKVFKPEGNNKRELVELFFDYISGRKLKGDPNNLLLKKKIFEEFAQEGITESWLKSLIKTPQDMIDYLVLYEFSHVRHGDHQNVRDNKVSKEEVETRASKNAILQLAAIKGMEVPFDSTKMSETLNILNEVERNNNALISFDAKTHTYKIDGKVADWSVTQWVHREEPKELDAEGKEVKNEFFKVSGALGTIHDEVSRDFFLNKLKDKYPNMSNEDLKNFTEIELPKFKDKLDKRFGKGHYKVITEESKLRVFGKILVGPNKYQTIAGTMDMIVVDSKGLIHIFDFKTKRANSSEDFDNKKATDYANQVYLYKALEEATYGKLKGKIASTNLVQFNILYDTPKGKGKYETGDVQYFLDESSNQLTLKIAGSPAILRIESAVRKNKSTFNRVYTAGKFYKTFDVSSFNFDDVVSAYSIDPEYSDDFTIVSEGESTTLDWDDDSSTRTIQTTEIKGVDWGDTSGIPYMDDASESETKTTTSLIELTLHSGGAYGADTAWDTIGREFGLVTAKHYRDESNTRLSKKLTDREIKATVLSKEELETAREEEFKLLGKKFDNTLQGNLQVRNYYQVKNSDGVFAIATLNNSKNGVTGGTNTAVQLGIKLNKPVYVWDLKTEQWYVYTNGSFQVTDTPRLTREFAGVGTRDIENYNTFDKATNKWVPRTEYVGMDKEVKATNAIRNVYEKTLKEGPQEVNKQLIIKKEDILTSNIFEVSTKGNEFGRKFSALNATFKQGTTIDGLDVSGKSIEDVYQHVIKKSGKNLAPALNSRIRVFYRGYALSENRKAKDLDETVANLANDYIENWNAKYHFTSDKEIAKSYGEVHTEDKGTSKPYAQVSAYYIDSSANIAYFNNLNDFRKNKEKATNVDIIILKDGTTGNNESEVIVKEGKSHLMHEIKDESTFSVEDLSYYEGYLPLWKEWAKQNPDLIEGLKLVSEGKVLTDSFATTRVSQARALTDILNSIDKKEESLIIDSIPTSSGPIEVKENKYYSVEPSVLTDSMYTGANKITIKANLEEGSNAELAREIDKLPVSSILYVEGEVGENLFQTIEGIEKMGLHRTLEQRVELLSDEDLIKSARKHGLKVDKDNKLYIPYYTVGLTLKEIVEIDLRDKLLANGLLNAKEIRTLSKMAVFKLSEYVTMLQSDFKANEILLGDKFIDTDFTGMSRIDIIKTVGLRNLFEIVQNRVFDIKNNPVDKRSTRKKMRIIKDNFDAFINFGYDTLIGMEEIALNSDTNIKNDLNTDFESDDELEIQEIFGSSAEHWQVGFRQVSAFSSLSLMIKRAFDKMYILDSKGQQVLNEFNLAETISPQEAVAKVLKWTQYAEDIEDMIEAIKSKRQSEPWVEYLIHEKTEEGDNFPVGKLIGKDNEQFRNQFYSNFKKYFLKYSISYMDNSGKVLIKMINENAYSDVILSTLKGKYASFRMGNFKMINENGSINKTLLAELEEILPKLNTDNVTQEVAEAAYRVYEILDIETPDFIEFRALLNKDSLSTLSTKLRFIIKDFNENLDSNDYNPVDKMTSLYKAIISIVANKMGESLESVSYEAGKLYYSYVLPSYLNVHIGKLQGHTKDYSKYIQEQYGQYEWFYKDGKYRNYWIKRIVEDENIRKTFDHKAALHYMDVNYVDKTPALYIESMMKEFFYDDNNIWAWYRVPTMSNKPSEEYLKFERFHEGFKQRITDLLVEVFNQEIDRIQTVRARQGLKEELKIKSFDKNGLRFQFLDYLNKYMDNPSTKLGELINKKLNATIKSEFAENDLLVSELKKVIEYEMSVKYKDARNQWVDEGFLIEGKDGSLSTGNLKLGETPEEVEKSLEEFFWNDTFASINILQIAVTDIAYYKNAEDLQKRLALIHAPGMRGNITAKDPEGKKYTDGLQRTLYLKDNNIKSDVLTNIKQLQEEVLNRIPLNQKALRALKKAQFESIIKEFSKINMADAQGYTSPTGYRKKMGIFGKWDQKQEDIYNKVLNGDLTEIDLSVVWQPLKPFVYTLIPKGSKTINSKTGKEVLLKVGVQNKNSEYLLIMVDALLKNGNKPNKLRAIFDIMEESAKLNPSKGIDTIQFESTVKCGLMGAVDINSLNSEEAIRNELRSKIYKEGNTSNDYNDDFVHSLPFEDYAIQQEVPNHFKGQQAHGSQDRILTVSDMPDNNENGEPNYILVGDDNITVAEAKLRYFEAIADNIQLSIDHLVKRFLLGSLNPKATNIAISRVLQAAILKDSRFGADLLWACSVNKNGEFNIPLSDPTLSNRIQLLLNSIIKNDINKQEIAGGPVVLVTNYGTSDELIIRFKNKEGKLLLSESEFNDNIDMGDKYIPKGKYTSYKKYCEENLNSVAYFECYAPIYSDTLFEDFKKPDGTINIEAIEKTNPDLLMMVGYRIPTESKYSMAPMKIKGFLPINAGEGIMLPKDIVTLSGSDFDIDKLYIMRYLFDREVGPIKKFDLAKAYMKEYNVKSKFRDEVLMSIDLIINGQKFSKGSMELHIYNYFLNHRREFQSIEYKEAEERRFKNDNYIIKTLLAILQSNMVLELLFTPGNFNEPKRVGYEIEAIKGGSKEAKNLVYNNILVLFHKQNMTAGKLIGVFAQANTSHAFMSLLPCYLSIPEELGFTLNGHTILNTTAIDKISNFNGEKISNILASFLAASVDAVKDPVLNLMNINIDTVNVVTTLVRLGFDIETIGYFTSQPAIINLVKDYNILKATKKASLEEFLQDRINTLAKDNGISGVLPDFNYTLKFFKDNINNDSSPINDFYLLSLFSKILVISKSFGLITHMTRYNSITAAVGPFASDTMQMYLKNEQFELDEMITEETKKAALDNPILKSFRNGAYLIERLLLGNNIIQASYTFLKALNKLQDRVPYLKKELINRFTDFFMAFYVNMQLDGKSPVFDLSYENRLKSIREFPLEFLGLKEKYPDNILMKNVIYTESPREKYPYLELKTRGVKSELIEDLKAAWSELLTLDRDLAIRLVEYNFFRGTFGFNPKTFMNLVPNDVKMALNNYVSKLNSNARPDIPSHVYDRMINLFMLHEDLNDNKSVKLSDYNLISLGTDKNSYIMSSSPKILGGINLTSGITNVLIDGSYKKAFINVNGALATITLIDTLGGKHLGIEIDVNKDFPNSIYNERLSKGIFSKTAQKLGETLGIMYSNSALKNKVANYDLINNLELRSKFLTIFQRDYEKYKGRSTTLEERDMIWNYKELLNIINVLHNTPLENISQVLKSANKTMKDLNLCN